MLNSCLIDAWYNPDRWLLDFCELSTDMRLLNTLGETRWWEAEWTDSLCTKIHKNFSKDQKDV